MFRRVIKLLPLAILSLPTLASAAEEGAAAVSPYAYELFKIGPFPVTNAMVTSWVISILIIIAIRLAVGKPQLIPSKGQAVVENLIGALRGTLEPIVGRHMIGRTFPLLIALFVFILIHNWSGLLPGVGAFGIYDESGRLDYWFRPGNADLNSTLALALVTMAAWLYFVLRYAGFGFLIKDLFGNKANPKEVPGPIYGFLFIIFFAVGIIEVISILFRPVSLSFRLFGNVFGGENLLTSMTGLVPFLVPIPFYALEILIGFVQALVFTLLAAVYIGLICNHDHGEESPAH